MTEYGLKGLHVAANRDLLDKVPEDVRYFVRCSNIATTARMAGLSRVRHFLPPRFIFAYLKKIRGICQQAMP